MIVDVIAVFFLGFIAGTLLVISIQLSMLRGTVSSFPKMLGTISGQLEVLIRKGPRP